MKRLIRSGTCLLLAVLLQTSVLASGNMGTLYSSVPDLSSSAAEVLPDLNPDIEMTARFDYDDQVRVGVAVPAFVRIDNKGPALEAILRVSVTPRRSDSASTYELPVSLDAGAKADYTVPFRASDSSDVIKVQLVERDRVVAQTVRARNTTPYTDRMLVGLFGANPQGLSYWHAYYALLDSSHAGVGVAVVELEAADLPEEYYLLDRFTLLVLSHFDLGYLNEAQVNALVHWVQDGGRLLVDGDTGGAQSLQSLRPLIDLKVTGAQPAMGADDPEADDSGFSPALGVIEPAGTVVRGNGERPLIMEYPVQKGRVFVTTFALDDPALETSDAAELFMTVPGLSAWSAAALEWFPTSYSGSADLTMSSAARSIAWLDAPHIAWVITILAAFIVLAGPVSYFVLKKRDKRDLLWITVPALSLCFCAVIAGYGVVSHGNQAVSSVITVVDQRDSAAAVRSFSLVGIAAPRQGSYQVTFGEEVFPYKLVERSYYYSYLSYDQNEPAGKPATRVDMSGYPSVTFEHIRQWSMDTVYLERDVVLQGGLTASIWYDASKVRYTVRNDTGVPLEDVTVATRMGSQRIPLLESGGEATGEIEEYATTSYSTSSYYLDPRLIRDIYGGSVDSASEEEKRENYHKSEMASLLIEYLSTDYLLVEPVVWAWSGDLGSLDMTANGKPVKNQLNSAMIIGAAHTTYGENAELHIPTGQVGGIIIDANGPYASSYLGETMAEFDYGDATFAFSLPDIVKDYVLEEFVVDVEMEYGDYTAELYNYRTDEWEQYWPALTLEGDHVQDYIYPDGTVLLRISREEPEDGEDLLDDMLFFYNPSIGVSGKEKTDAGN